MAQARSLAPDRMGKIAKFNSDAYAILEGTASQSTSWAHLSSPNDHLLMPKLTVAQNEALEAKIQRRPSRIMNSKKPAAPTSHLAVPAGPAAASTHGTVASGAPSSFAGSSHGVLLGSVPLSTSLGPSSSHGPQIFLRVRVGDASDDVHVSTTIPVYVCRSSTPTFVCAHLLCLSQIGWYVYAGSPGTRVQASEAAQSKRLCPCSSFAKPRRHPSPSGQDGREFAGK